MKVTKAKWLTGSNDGNRTFARLLVTYDNGTYEEIKVKLNGESNVRFWHYVTPWELDPFEGWLYEDLSFKIDMAIFEIIGLTKTEAHKEIKRKEKMWKTQIERANKSEAEMLYGNVDEKRGII